LELRRTISKSVKLLLGAYP